MTKVLGQKSWDTFACGMEEKFLKIPLHNAVLFCLFLFCFLFFLFLTKVHQQHCLGWGGGAGSRKERVGIISCNVEAKMVYICDMKKNW